MLYTAAAVALALGIFAAAAILRPTGGTRHEKFEAVDVTGANWGKGFELTDHNGKRRTLKDFHGKVVLLYFGYINCPDMCPIIMAKLGAAVRQLGDAGNAVQGLFVTVDPKRDTPQVLAQYVPSFHPSFLGLYGDEQTLDRTTKEFKVYSKAQAPGSSGFYTVDHSSQVFVFDGGGRLRLFIRPEATPESIARDIRILLKETN